MSERLEGALFHRSPVGAAALTLVGVGLAVWAVINAPMFGIDRIRVEGVKELTEDEVRALAGVEPGTNLLRLSLENVAAAVERSPWIIDAAAGRSLPATLVLRVAERRPVGWVQDPRGPAVVAGDGTVVRAGSPTPSDLPGLGTVPEPVRPGERLGDVPTLKVAAAMADPLLAAVASVTEVDGALVLELRRGGRVEYGEARQLPAKNRALSGLLAWAEERGLAIDSIDLRVPSAPALQPIG